MPIFAVEKKIILTVYINFLPSEERLPHESVGRAREALQLELHLGILPCHHGEAHGGHVARLLDVLQKPVRGDELVLPVNHGGSLGGQEVVDVGPGGCRHVPL